MSEMRVSYTIRWTTRNGGETAWTTTGDPGDSVLTVMTHCDALARRDGYEGHRGGWWRYLLSDLGLLKGNPPIAEQLGQPS